MRRVYNLQLTVCSLILLIILSACTTEKEDLQNTELIKLGAILPLTGSGSDQGIWAQQTFEIVKEELAQQGIKLEIIYQDSKGGNSQEAINGYKAITQFNNVPAVLTWGSGVGLALSPLANQDKILQMGIAIATPTYTSKEDYNFRVFPSATLDGTYSGQAAAEQLKAKTAGIAYINNDYGVGEKESFAKSFEQVGGKVLISEAIEPGSTDVLTQILKIKKEKPELVFLAVYPREGILFLKQAKEQGLDTTTLAASAILSNELKQKAEGLLITRQLFETTTPEAQEFIAKYTTKHNQEPEIYHTYAYDALKIVVNALQKCAVKDGDCLKKQLETIQPYKGLGEEITFDANGDRTNAEFKIMRVQNGKLVSY